MEFFTNEQLKTISNTSTTMTNKTLIYETPHIEVIEVDVEQGFASSNTDTEGYTPEGWN